MKPTTGRVVLYDDGTNKFLALIVRPMPDNGGHPVNLVVFTDYPDGNDGFETKHVRNAVQGDAPGQWNWPPRV
jgi:hypothetical protein